MRLSFSSDKVFDNCPRKFQLFKVLQAGEREYTVSPHTMFGTAFGKAAAELLVSGGDIERAIGVALCSWDHTLEYGNKCWPTLVNALFQVHAQFPWEEYEPLYYADGRPCLEVGAKIWLDSEGDKDYYVLFIDVVLLRKDTKQPTIIEIKTTGQGGEIAPMYSNSPQSVLYSLPLPYLFPQYKEHNWDTMYLVCQVKSTWEVEIHMPVFPHLYTERLAVLMSLLMRYEYIGKMKEVGLFPKTSTGDCISYGKPCQFYGICDNLAQTCAEQSIEEQNTMGGEREGQVVLGLHIQELLSLEMGRDIDGVASI